VVGACRCWGEELESEGRETDKALILDEEATQGNSQGFE
jgi:hypothetical protein